MDVRLTGTFTLLSPLSHIGETISAVSYLVQEPIIQPDGSVAEVFVYSGNAWRGQLRDLSAAYLLDAFGAPRVDIDTFHLLFAGGKIGGEQSVNIEQARRWRRAVPHVALWGGGIGNQLLPGKLRVRNCYPVVREAIPVLPADLRERALATPYASVTFEKPLSRKDDLKNAQLAEHYSSIAAPAGEQQLLLDDGGGRQGRAAKEPPPEQMRITAELVAPGTVLATGIDVLDCTEVELGCLVAALHRFARSPHIGGQASRGFGLVRLEYSLINLDTGETMPFLAVEDGLAWLEPPAKAAKEAYDEQLREAYDRYLADNRSEILPLLGGKA
jgi:hypothetical protein